MGRRCLVLIATLLAVVVFACPAFAQDAKEECLLCTGKRSLQCPTCDGKGRGLAVCRTCGGQGKGGCHEHEGIGRSPCPNPVCRDGEVVWDDGKAYACKLCGKRGSVKCRRCVEAPRVRCAACKGKRRVEGECDDCNATGTLPCLPCARGEAVCGVCADKRVVTCPRCKGTGGAEEPCLPCLGNGEDVCPRCEGVGKRSCEDCGSTGKARAKYEDGTTAASKKCTRCSKKGVLSCSCKKGLAPCRACQGLGTTSGVCRLCSPAGSVACHGCGRLSFRVLELEAGLLVALGSVDQGAELYRRALAIARRAQREATAELETKRKSLPRLEVPEDPTSSEQVAAALKKFLAAMDERATRLAAAHAQAFEGQEAVTRIERVLAVFPGQEDDDE